MKYCENCGKEIIKQVWESADYFKRKRFCSQQCCGAFNHKKYLEREDVQAEIKRREESIAHAAELSKYCRPGYVHPLYNAWKNMRRRCDNPNTKFYKNYGGRGIKVCKEWDADPLVFIRWALANGWEQGLTLDRIDNGGNYSPDNCRWITRQKQLLNRRNNRIMTFNGKSQTMKEWADEIGISPQTLSQRVNRNGWSDEKALTEPIDTSKIRIKKTAP